MIKNGDETAKTVLFEKYRRYASFLAAEYSKNYPDLPLCEDDYMSYAFSAVAITLDKYLQDPTIRFNSYWLMVARNDIRRFIKDYCEKNHHLINNSISLDNITTSNDCSLHEVVGSNDRTEQYLLRDAIIQIIKDNENIFDDTDVSFMELYLDGYTIKEIAVMLNRSESNMFQRYDCIISQLRIIFTKKK